VATKDQWDKIMAENPGKAVSAEGGRRLICCKTFAKKAQA
jgi:hypothetical protein